METKKLLFFYGLECPHCITMEKLVDKLIDQGFLIEKLEIWHNKENEKLLEGLDTGDDMCGGVPFFINIENKKTICGEVSFAGLEKWAKGE